MFSLKPGDTFAENYKLVKQVDVGGFAEVWEGLFLGKRVALKIFPKLDAEGIANIENEYKDQADLLHSNLLIPRYYGITMGQPFLEMRFCDGGNAAKNVGKYTEAEIAKCIHQIGSALAYLHEQDIVHQDIKPNNFLLDRDGNYYLADLGLSMKVRQTIKRFTQTQQINNESVTKKTTGLTPPCYRAPELYERPSKPLTPLMATDVWSLGASIFEMADGELPFGDLGGMMQKNDPSSPDLPSSYSQELNEIIKLCMAKETWERPKASDITEWAGNYLKRGFYREKSIAVPEPLIREPLHPQLSTNPGRRWTFYLACILVSAVAAGLIYLKVTPDKPYEKPIIEINKMSDTSLVQKQQGSIKKNSTDKNIAPVKSKDLDSDSIPNKVDKYPVVAGDKKHYEYHKNSVKTKNTTIGRKSKSQIKEPEGSLKRDEEQKF